jgi:very-short-patch-repair endonuclease
MKEHEYSMEVLACLDRCADLVGRHEKDGFDQDVFCEYGDLAIESPIEQLFYTAFKTVLKLNYLPLHDAVAVNGVGATYGMLIQPQWAIQSYRVDFHISWLGYAPHQNPASKCVVVECDSQQWHERDEKERRYEKRRDRELIKLGLHTFRFTGKEIKEDPFAPAIEVCQFLTGSRYDDFHSYIQELSEVR